MVNWTTGSKYDIPNVKLDLRLGHFGVNAFIEARFYFTLGFSSGGVLFFWSAPSACQNSQIFFASDYPDNTPGRALHIFALAKVAKIIWSVSRDPWYHFCTMPQQCESFPRAQQSIFI